MIDGQLEGAGTHRVFLAAVERAAARGGAPLAYFSGRFGRLHRIRPDATRAAPAADKRHLQLDLFAESLVEEAGELRDHRPMEVDA